MQIQPHNINNKQIAELISEEVLINTAEEGLDLLGDLYYQGFDKIIVYEKNVSPAFFDLKNGMAGELLQKFSNYRIQFAIVGDFSKYTSKSVQDFIYESNKVGHINFVNSLQEALK